MQNKRYKLLTLLLALMMVLSFVPNVFNLTQAQADEITEPITVAKPVTEEKSATNEEFDINEQLEPEELPKKGKESAQIQNSDQAVLDNALADLNGAALFRAQYGTDINANTMIELWLETKGHGGISVSIAEETDIQNSSVYAGTYTKINLDGSLEYFYVDPDENLSAANLGFANFKIKFTLSKGDLSAKSESKTVQLKWDEAKVKDLIQNKSIAKFNLATALAPNSSAEQVTENFKLPYCIDQKLWFKVTWTSDDPAVVVASNYTTPTGEFLPTNAYYPVTVKQGAEAKNVNITAKYHFDRSDAEHIVIEKTYQITVPAIDLTEIEQKMQADLDAYFVPQVLNYRSPNAGVSFDSNNVLYNFQLPNNRAIRNDTVVDGEVVSKGIGNLYLDYVTSGTGFSFFEFTPDGVEVDSGGITRNGYIGNVTLPQAGEKQKKVDLTMTLRHKEYDLSVSKTITLTLNPLDYDEFMAKVERNAELMALVKANFFAALNGNPDQTANAASNQIKHDLSSFREVRFAKPDDPNDKTLEYIYKREQIKGDGVVLAPITGWEVQEAWRVLRSSNPRYLAHENLLVNEPIYNTEISIDAMLNIPAMEQYKDYFSGDNSSPEAQKLASLFNQPISQNVTVLGKEGDPPADYEQEIPAELIVEGSKILKTKEDHSTAHETWYSSNETIPRDTTIVSFARQTLAKNPEITLDMDDSGWLTSIEFEDYPMNKTGETNGPASSWMWYVKHQGDSEFQLVSSLDPKDDAAYVKKGDVIKLKFINDPRYPFNVADQTPEQPIELKDDSDIVGWTGFRGDAQNKTPVRELETIPEIIREQIWDSINTNINEWGYPSTISDLLSINDKIYYATENKLIRLNEQGVIDGELELAGSIEYFSRLTYSNGMIIIPVQGGGVQAIDTFTMTSLWVVGSIDSLEKWEPDDNGEWVQNFYPVQSLGTPLIDNGVVYVPITAPSYPDTAGGVLRAIDMSTGKEIWRYNNSMDAGFYWGGATKIGDYLIIGDDSGYVHAISIDDGEKIEISKIADSKIRSTVVSQGEYVYFTTTDGTFHSIKFNPDSGAKFSEHKEIKFAGASTSTPTIYNGKAYIGGLGGDGGWGAPGAFAVIDLASMAVEYSSEDIIGEVKSAPLVLHDTNGVYAYFTGNSEQGLLYVYHAGKVELAYRPSHDQAQYTTATPIVDQNGNIYYTTDAAVIALRSRIDSQLNEFELKIVSSIGDATFEIADDPKLLKHSSLQITDATNGIKLLYGEDIEKELGEIDYAAFQTKFEGQAEENPSITIKLTVDQEYLPLTENQEYKLYKLVGSQLVEVGLNNPSAQAGRMMSIKPMLLSQLNNQLLQTPAANRTISFNQLLKDNSTYVLAATNVVAPTPEEPTDPEKSVEPEQEASQPYGGQVTEKETVQAKADTAQTSTTSTSQAQQLARTGEQILIIPGIVSIMIAGVLILVKKVSKHSEKTE
ncbi:MAG: PQQ-binding-like beta-propeller repeat protein [Bacillota bacterium]|nr:PQQ-binding-like beta-propeller repeat protein [Bacillota bacterium]